MNPSLNTNTISACDIIKFAPLDKCVQMWQFPRWLSSAIRRKFSALVSHEARQTHPGKRALRSLCSVLVAKTRTRHPAASACRAEETAWWATASCRTATMPQCVWGREKLMSGFSFHVESVRQGFYKLFNIEFTKPWRPHLVLLFNFLEFLFWKNICCFSPSHRLYWL